MKRLFIAVALGALAAPAAAVAAPSKSDRSEGQRECRTLQRTVDTRANFVALVKLEASANRRNAFGRCVTVRSKAAQQERTEARSSAVAECRALHPKPGPGAGRPEQGEQRNAFGKCVSQRAQAKNAAADTEQRRESLNPAKACRAEQKADRTKFASDHGSGSNAFGRCVSRKAQAQNDDAPQS